MFLGNFDCILVKLQKKEVIRSQIHTVKRGTTNYKLKTQNDHTIINR